MLFKVTIPGRPIVKKNTQRSFGSGFRKHIVYSPRFLSWEKDAIIACTKAKLNKAIDNPVLCRVKFYFENHQAEADVSNLCEGFQDVLQKCDIIKNDKLIYRLEAEKIFGQGARTEVELYDLSSL